MLDNCSLSFSEAFVAIATQQLKQQTQFYSAAFSCTPAVSAPTYSEFRLSGLKLALFVPGDRHQQTFQAPSSGPMSLCVEVDDLEAAIAHLTKLGYPPPGEIITASHGQEIYAYDLDGNRLILHQS